VQGYHFLKNEQQPFMIFFRNQTADINEYLFTIEDRFSLRGRWPWDDNLINSDGDHGNLLAVIGIGRNKILLTDLTYGDHMIHLFE
jgi:hypothetical protein